MSIEEHRRYMRQYMRGKRSDPAVRLRMRLQDAATLLRRHGYTVIPPSVVTEQSEGGECE